MATQHKRTRLHHIIATTFIAGAISLAPAVASGQDSVRDRLSPGNGADWAGEPQADENGTDATSSITAPGPEQAWYRGNDGRFFFRDSDGRQIFEDQVYRQADARQSQRPLLGVALQDTPQGLQIAGVTPNSAAANAGLRQGDLITRLSDQPASNANEFTQRVGSMRPGDQLPLTITRNGQQQTINATLGTQPIRYQVARPNWTEPMRNFDESYNRLRQDFESLRSQLDQLRSDVDGITGAVNAAAKQQAIDVE